VASKSKPIELIVRRGALRRFRNLKEKTAALPVQVSWDRRVSDSRTASASVGPDRRKKPPFTWELSDFVVAAKSPSRRKKKS
jgi:hypothetical protein